MKVLKIEIFSPEIKLMRSIEFNKTGLSIIYGDVEKPNKENATSNSIGKTVLLRILNVVMGAKNSGKDTINGLSGFIVKSVVLHNGINYNVELTIGSSKSYYVNGEKLTLNKYKEKFDINRSFCNKQINLDKRKGLISSIAKNANKDDISTVLKLLYLDDIQLIFMKIKKMQEEIELISKFNNSYKDDINLLEKDSFNYEMKRKQIDDELSELNVRIKDLQISRDIEEIAKKRLELDQQLKSKIEKRKINDIRIAKYETMLNDVSDNCISVVDVKKIYEQAKVEVPELIVKKLEEVELFYDSLLSDKKDIYIAQIAELKKKNKLLKNEIENETLELDKLSKIISENDLFLEAIKIYDNKTNEKIIIETKISEINSKLNQINDSKIMKSKIDTCYIDLSDNFEISKLIINKYREFIYNMVEKIYGEERNPYLTINVSDGSYKYKALPVKIDLSIDGDSGEGITAAKYLLFDYLIMNYNEEIDFLIEDSSCFEGIDRRQLKSILIEGSKISFEKDKQFIVSLNKYHVDIEDFKDDIILTLSENDTLLNIKF